MGKVKTVDFSESIAASDLKVGISGERLQDQWSSGLSFLQSFRRNQV